MKHLIVAAVAITALASSCKLFSVNENFVDGGKIVVASETYLTRSFEVDGFNSLVCNIPAKIVLSTGSNALDIEAPDNIMEHIVVNVEDGCLAIRSDGSTFTQMDNLNIRLSAPEMRSITVNGATELHAPDGIAAEDLDVEVNGAAEMYINNPCTGNFSLRINGAGSAEVSGIANRSMTVAISGAGDCILSGRTEVANVTVKGAGSVDISGLVADTVNSSVRGAGNVRMPD